MTDVHSHTGAPGDDANDTNFDCGICMDKAAEPVVTQCGHLFCWPCLGEWLRRANDCPICKAGCARDNVIPLYGKGKSRPGPQGPSSARSAGPAPNAPRPQAHRPPTPPRRPFSSDFSAHVFGPALFPFLFWSDSSPAHLEWNDEMKSKVALYVGLLLILYLIVLPN